MLTGEEAERMAYLAGFTDGEGCVRWAHGPCLELTNTNRDILETIRAEIGGVIRQTNAGKRGEKDRSCWRLALHGETAEALLFKLLPWLCIKRQQAQIVLDLAAARRTDTLTSEVLEEGLEFLKVDKAVAFDVRSDSETNE